MFSPAGAGPPVVVDVNETISDMAPMADRFRRARRAGHLAALWFASLLRDAFALTAAGTRERFAVLADGRLRGVLAGERLDRDLDAALRALRATGRRLVTLSNGSAEVAERLLGRAGAARGVRRAAVLEDAGCGSPPAGPPSTPRGPAAPSSPTWCSSRRTPGTSTAPPAPG